MSQQELIKERRGRESPIYRTPKEKASAGYLEEQVRQKIEKINTDLMNSEGLTRKELEIAISLGLIDSDQSYFWTEEWQKGYRKAQKEIEEGKYEVFEDINNLLDYLHR